MVYIMLYDVIHIGGNSPGCLSQKKRVAAHFSACAHSAVGSNQSLARLKPSCAFKAGQPLNRGVSNKKVPYAYSPPDLSVFTVTHI